MELRAGARLDRYTLVAPLGEGGQASVWKAIDPLDGGAVRALKVFRLSAGSADDGERARREAKAVAGSQHPGLLPCRTLLEDPAAGIVVLVFDYARGQSLADALADRRMTPEHRRAAVRHIADTLAYVHGRGVLHRDVKPDNVLVTDLFWQSPDEAGTLKLVDFGIAASAGNPKPLTRAGGVVGTAPYLPPELLDQSGAFLAGDDFRRDVFAFGVLAWEVLVGGHPTGLPIGASRDAFAGIYLSAHAGKRAWPPAAPPSPELAIVRACLALSWMDRPASCVAVAEALRAGVTDSALSRPSYPAFSEQQPRSSGTELHVPPRTDPGIQARTSPGPARPSHPGTAPAYYQNSQYSSMSDVAGRAPPFGIAPAPAPAARRRSSVPWIAGVLVVGGALIFGRCLLASGSSGSEPRPLVLPPPEAAPAPSPVLAPESPVPRREVVACCNDDSMKCRSERPCRPPPCDLLDNGPWRLRVGGGFVRSGAGLVEIHREWQSSRICIKNTRTGEEQCASSDTIYTKGSDHANRVLATTGDISSGNLVVRIDGAPRLVNETAFGSPTGYKATALCMGVVLHLRAVNPDIGRITVFLDDPSAP